MRKWQFRTSQIICLLGLAGCNATGQLLPQAVVNTQVFYPNLPDITPPTVPAMRPVHVIFPKDTSQFITIDQANWANLAYNIQALKTVILEDHARINAVNKERADWRDKNAKAVAALPKPVEKPAGVKP
ncbi:MAG TPA: hypothetical protein VNX68_17385 [Nitrosopumilaceae archaeon]|nr:hypothetical protein [Nitrosopumilaceae archaeon]